MQPKQIQATIFHLIILKEKVEGNLIHVLYHVDNGTDVDVIRAKGHNGNISEVRIDFDLLSNGHDHNFSTSLI